MNGLNTQQIVLLCLLVSFVTAISTAIAVVSLSDQNPKPVTQTVNRIVERTIETVTESNENGNDKPVERVVETVVVNQEDLTVEAVAKNSRSIVRIYSVNLDARNFIGLGIVINKGGRILTDASLIVPDGKYVAKYDKGEFGVNPISVNQSPVFILLEPIEVGTTEFSPATFGNSQNLKLAQSVISLSGQDENTVSTGIITNLVAQSGNLSEEEVQSDSPPVETITTIKTSVDPSNVLTGSILLNLQGELIGAKINGDLTLKTNFMPVNSIFGFLNTITQ